MVTIDASTNRERRSRTSRGVHISRRGHRLRCGEVEVPGEHREPVEHELLRFVEQVVAPVERGSERLMPSIGGGGSIGERVEPVGEPVAEFGGAEDRGTGGGELDGQGDSVEVATDLAHGDEALGVDRRGSLVGPVGEESHRVEEREVVAGRVRWWQLEGLDRSPELAGEMEGCTGGGQHTGLGSGLE